MSAGLGPFKNRNTDGWEKTGGVHDRTYKATLRVKKRYKTTGRGGGNRVDDRSIRVIVNSATGAFDVYETYGFLGGGDKRIGSYSPSSNKFSAVSGQEATFNAYFSGADNASQRQNIVKTSKETVLAIAGRDAIAPNRIEDYNKIALLDGYQSLSGAKEEPAQTLDDGPRPVVEDGEQTSEATVDTDGSVTEPAPDQGDQGDQGEGTVTGSGGNIDDANSSGQFTDNKKKFLSYPQAVPDFGYDFIRFTAFRYVKPGLEDAGNDVGGRYLKKDTKVTITLPMQPNFSESNSVDWGGDKINPLQLALGRTAAGLIENLGNINIGGMMGVAGQAMDRLKEMAADPNAEQALIAYFAGQAVGANAFTRSTGTVLNPNMELLFTGPRLRTFAFNFKMTPRFPKEAAEIRDIIKTFKKYAAPIKSDSELFLQTPHIFKIEYLYNNDGKTQIQHPYLNKIKHCALTSFNVNYTPEGSYMTYDGGSLPSYEIAMSFGELQPIYANDYNEDSNDMGY